MASRSKMPHFESDDTIAVRSCGNAIRLAVVNQIVEPELSDSSESESSADERTSAADKQEMLRIEYPSGRKSKILPDHAVLVDRSLMIGESVKSIDDPNKIGVVIDCQALDAGNTYVLYNGWIGDLETVDHELLVRSLKKGYRCRIVVEPDVEIYSHRESLLRLPYGMRHLAALGRHLYPGQLVEISPRSILRHAYYLPSGKLPASLKNRFAKCVDEQKLLTFAVEQVQIKRVTVRWLTSLDPLNSSTPPPEIIADEEAQKLVKLAHFEHQSCQVADRMTGTLGPDDQLLEYDAWSSQLCGTFKELLLSPKKQAGAKQGGSADSGENEDENSQEQPAAVAQSSSATAAAHLDTSTSDSYVTASEGQHTPSDLGSPAPSDPHEQDSGVGGAVVAVQQQQQRPLSNGAHRALPKNTTAFMRLKTSVPLINRHRKYVKLLQRRRESAAAAVKRRQQANSRVTRSRLPAAVGDQFFGEIVMQRSFLKVVWQDGSTSDRVPATSLSYCDYDLDQHVFLPGHIVELQEADAATDQSSTSALSYGVVEAVDAAERIATVHWFASEAASGGNDTVATKRGVQQCSVLDIKYHENYEWLTASHLVLSAAPNQPTDGDVAFESQVGQVLFVDAQTGRALVRWFDGTESYRQPCQLIQALYGDEFDDEASEEDEDEWPAPTADSKSDGKTEENNGSSSDWETTSEQSVEEDASLLQSVPDSIKPAVSRSSITTRSRASTQPTKSSASTGIDSSFEPDSPAVRLRSSHASASSSSKADSVAADPPSHKRRRLSSAKKEEKDSSSSAKVSGKKPQPSASGSLEYVPVCPPAHHFAASAKCAAPVPLWTKAVRNEVKLLGHGLPPSIHVRTFEDRMDLFSCLIVGPSDTPYEGGLFVFDVRLPEQYPAVPPLVHYRSFSSEQLNPNLYQDGKVCVSLLGTWSGKSSERWNPGSNLLQVFVSIQGLILNKEPYFNEAGYDARRSLPDAAELSRKYNENALIRSLENLQRTAEKPPPHWATLVAQHLRLHADDLLARVERWLAVGDCDFPLHPVSEGCKLSVRARLAKLRLTIQQLQQQQQPSTS